MAGHISGHWNISLHLICVLYLFQIVAGVTEPGVLATVSTKNYRQLENCSFPLSFNITINAPSINVSIHLQRNVNVNLDAPVYVNTADSGFKRIDLDDDTSDFAVYYAEKPSATVSIRCPMKSRNKKDVQFHGSIYLNGQLYSVSPAQQTASQWSVAISKSQSLIYLRSDIEKSMTLYGDYTYSEKSFIPTQTFIQTTKSDVQRRIRRASTWTPYIVEVLVVIDNSVFKVWYDKLTTGSKEERNKNARANLRRYFAHIISGVDKLYKDIAFVDLDVRVRLAGYIIIKNVDMYPWTEYRKVSANPRDQLEANLALKDFRAWIQNQTSFPEHDHAMLFTSYDLFTRNSEPIRTHTAGLAFIGTVCQRGDSVSIVEEHGGFQSIGTAAHELGHSLGARHDGEQNECMSEDRYIMAAAGFGPVPESKRHNPWHFSQCSVNYFRNFIASLLARGSNCLLTETVAPLKVEISTPPGQEFDPDQQCRLIWGPQSYLCRGAEFGNASTICTAMYCKDPSTAHDCVLHTAARGTSCGHKQWCIRGVCTYSEQAPAKHEHCVLGDQPGAAFNGLTCSQLLYPSASYCYQEKVRARCCGTCRRHFTRRRGCEYGDRVKGCLLWHCNHVFDKRDISKDCCSTCNVGEIIDSTLRPDVPVTNLSDTPTLCSDVPDVIGLKCKTFIQTHGVHSCYNPSVSKLCCQSCRKTQLSSEPGCEFGDQSPILCTKISNTTVLYCDTYVRQCCQSCIVRRDNSGNTNIRSSPNVVLALIFLNFLLLTFLH